MNRLEQYTPYVRSATATSDSGGMQRAFLAERFPEDISYIGSGYARPSLAPT